MLKQNFLLFSRFFFLHRLSSCIFFGHDIWDSRHGLGVMEICNFGGISTGQIREKETETEQVFARVRLDHFIELDSFSPLHT